MITVQDALGRPNKDLSKEKKTSKGYAGTVQDADWRPNKELDNCGRKGAYLLNKVQGEYEK
jgi:hypothetical protein